MKKILITGSKGFLGRHLVERLNEKYELLAPSSSELNIENWLFNNLTPLYQKTRK